MHGVLQSIDGLADCLLQSTRCTLKSKVEAVSNHIHSVLEAAAKLTGQPQDCICCSVLRLF